MKRFSEDDVIELAKSIFGGASCVKVGIGDDCCVLDVHGNNLVASSDMLVDEVHFILGPFTFYQVGLKAVLANISDVVAMGGDPLFMLFSVGMPPDLSIEQVEELFRGVSDGAKRYGCTVVGGDTCRSEKLVVSITVFGECERPVLRSGAEFGDILFVTGIPGVSSVGLEALLEGYPEDLFAPFIERHVSPVLRAELARSLSAAGVVSSMIDISDGLAKDAERLAKASGVCLKILYSHLPPLGLKEAHHRYIKKDEDYYKLFGGEDYELLFTVPPKKRDFVLEEAERLGVPVCEIGFACKGDGVYLIRNQRIERLQHGGYEHF